MPSLQAVSPRIAAAVARRAAVRILAVDQPIAVVVAHVAAADLDEEGELARAARRRRRRRHAFLGRAARGVGAVDEAIAVVVEAIGAARLGGHAAARAARQHGAVGISAVDQTVAVLVGALGPQSSNSPQLDPPGSFPVAVLVDAVALDLGARQDGAIADVPRVELAERDAVLHAVATGADVAAARIARPAVLPLVQAGHAQPSST
jgi:hypothetical protein